MNIIIIVSSIYDGVCFGSVVVVISFIIPYSIFFSFCCTSCCLVWKRKWKSSMWTNCSHVSHICVYCANVQIYTRTLSIWVFPTSAHMHLSLWIFGECRPKFAIFCFFMCLCAWVCVCVLLIFLLLAVSGCLFHHSTNHAYAWRNGRQRYEKSKQDQIYIDLFILQPNTWTTHHIIDR